MTFIDWYSVEASVSHVSRLYSGVKFSGVYGVPRGGLVLAVMISHKMGIPLLQHPKDCCLVVDDCYETGRTLDPLREENPGAAFYVLAAKKDFIYGDAYRQTDLKNWLVFPWEDKSKAQADYENYASRQ